MNLVDLVKYGRSRQRTAADDEKSRQKTAGRTGVGALIVAYETGRILFNLRSKFVNNPNTWGTWGGMVDKGENPKIALMREIGEEAGFNRNMFIGGAELLQSHYPDNDFTYQNYLLLSKKEYKPRPKLGSRHEIGGYRWVEYGDWPTPMHVGLKALLSDPTSLQTIKTFVDRSNHE